jgi:hypothetical protein
MMAAVRTVNQVRFFPIAAMAAQDVSQRLRGLRNQKTDAFYATRSIALDVQISPGWLL